MKTKRSRKLRFVIGGVALAVGLGVIAPVLGEDVGGNQEYIINGNPADVGEYPFAVSLSLSRTDGNRVCGGSLIDPFYVLTAAHCVVSATGTARTTSATARIGATNLNDPSQGESRTIVEFNVHPRFLQDAGTLTNDVAVLRLNQASRMRPIELATPEEPSDAAFWPSGTAATVIGWGQTTPTAGSGTTWLQETTLSTLSDQNAAAALPEFAINGPIHVGAQGNNTSHCKGDSGGPLFVGTTQGRQQIGVVSFGPTPCNATRPRVYAEVAGAYLSRWVRTIIDTTAMVGDVDGDGDGDLVMATHQPEKRVTVSKSLIKETGSLRQDTSREWHNNFVNDGDQVLLADYNGDGKADIWSVSDGDVWVAASSGSNFYGAGGTWRSGLLRRGETARAGDLDGDGRADLFIFTNDAQRDIYLARSTATGFGPRVKVSDWGPDAGATPDVIDLNADRKADVVEYVSYVNGGSIQTYLSTGYSLRSSDYNQSNLPKAGMHATVGHFNADRRGDAIAFDRDTSNYDVNVQLRNATSGYGLKTKWHEWFGAVGHTLDAADVNGDGLDDIVALTNGGPFGEYWVALNEGGARFGAGTLVAYYNA